nr:serine hydrolase domain-containing protein [Sphingomicrobium sediminis]
MLLIPVAIALGGCPPTEKHIRGGAAAPPSIVYSTAVGQALDEGNFIGAFAWSGLDGDWPELTNNNAPWPWASVTKQIVATLVMQQVDAGRMALDAPAYAYLPEIGEGSPTVRQLLQHQSGLRNPDESDPDAEGLPSFYTDGPTGLDWCLAERGPVPSEGWSYNNCDYIVLGAMLERLTGKTLADLMQRDIFEPAGIKYTDFADVESDWGIFGAEEEMLARVARYGASAGLVGQPREMVKFDRALMDGLLLSEEARAEMWAGDPALGYMGLGQWSFPAPLAGCEEPVQLVERRGGIGPYQIRNFIAPDRGAALALLTYQPDFEFGEIWTGEGFSFDVLSAALCGEGDAQ